MDLRSNGIRKYPREPLSRESINTGKKGGGGGRTRGGGRNLTAKKIQKIPKYGQILIN